MYLSAEGDYDATPSPNLLTIEGGQEIACTNITINDDIFVETLEVFGVSVVAINSTFSAGVTLTQDVASIEIIDDGRFVCAHGQPLFYTPVLIYNVRLYTFKVDLLVSLMTCRRRYICTA